MKQSSRQSDFWTVSTLGRVAWALMLLMHAPALVGVWKGFFTTGFDAALLGPCLGLTAACFFFLLKCYGVRVLRFNTSPGSCVTITLALVLVHGDVINAPAGGLIGPMYDPIIATSLLLAGTAGARRLLRDISAGFGLPPKATVPPSLAGQRVPIDAVSAVLRSISLRASIPRAPPV